MSAKPPLKIVLCSPRGFCAGVVRAIDTVERALTIYGAPVYVRHEIVHNKYVVDSLRTKGAIFVEELAEIPDNTNAPVVFSAHGVPKSVPADARARMLAGAIATRRPAAIARRHVLLVDDVLTSGATARDCTRALLGAGAAGVDVLVAARVRHPG